MLLLETEKSELTELADFQKYQYRFTQHLRDPQNNTKPQGIEDRRMAIYRDLLFNNINSFIESGFPVLRTLYRDEAWLLLIRKFFANHKSHTPYFIEISQEFLAFLQNEYEPTAEDPAFLLELAHYEWVELNLIVSKESINLENINPHGNLLEEIPVISPLAMPLAYQWDVQHICADYQPDTVPKQATYLVVHRDENDAVNFIEANPVTARLLALIQSEQIQSGQQALMQVAQEMQHPEPDLVVQGGHQILLKLQKAGVVLGTKIRH